MFLSYYPNRFRTIFKNVSGETWFTVNANTPLPDELLLDSISGQAKYFRGLRWGDQTRFVVLDIDIGSQYHNVSALIDLKLALTSIGIRHFRLYRSGISQGWHLYLPLQGWASAQEVSGTLKSYLRASGFSLRSGQLEVFPSGSGLRLPLQKGFAWLDDSGNVTVDRAELSQNEALDRFVTDIESGGAEWNYTKSRIQEFLEASERKRTQDSTSLEGFESFFEHNVIRESYDAGKNYWLNGLTKNGERHKALLCVEHYLWHGDESIGLPAHPGRSNDERRMQLLIDWLRKKHNGCCNRINANDWRTVEADIRRACVWRANYIPERKPYLLVSESAIDRMCHLSQTYSRTWRLEDWRKGNEKSEAKARRKIEDAVNICLAQGQQISRGVLVGITGCSINTVKKHGDLWRHLAIGSSDLEPGGMAQGAVFSSEKENLLVFPEILFSSGSEVSSSELPVLKIDSISILEILDEACPLSFPGESDVSHLGDLNEIGFSSEGSFDSEPVQLKLRLVCSADESFGYRTDITAEDRFKPAEIAAGSPSPVESRNRSLRSLPEVLAAKGQLVIDLRLRRKFEVGGRGPP